MNKQNFLEEINRAGYDRKKEKKFLENYIKSKEADKIKIKRGSLIWFLERMDIHGRIILEEWEGNPKDLEKTLESLRWASKKSCSNSIMDYHKLKTAIQIYGGEFKKEMFIIPYSDKDFFNTPYIYFSLHLFKK